MSTTRFQLDAPFEREDKTYWTNNVGVMFPLKNGGGYTIKLRCVPTPGANGEITIIARPPQPKDEQPRQGNRPAARDEDMDSVPF